jgi:transcriptional regulator with XRE-family HTH domain
MVMVNKIPYGTSKIRGSQIRAARALLRWTAADLAARSKLGIMTIRRAEAVDGPVPITVANAETIARTFEAAGVEFTNGNAPGVRLKPRRRG